jgi:hypothetical protein
MKKLALTVAALMATTSVPAMAAPIIYTLTGNFSGTANGNSFDLTPVTFTAVGDTEDAFNQQDATFVPLSSFQATGATFGTFDLGSGFNFWSSPSYQTSGYKTGVDFFAFTGLGDYSNTASLAPTAVSFYYFSPDAFTAVGTQGQGTYSFTFNGAANTFFSANVAAVAAVPEPATWAMMMLGFGMVGFGLRRRSNVKTSVSYA